ncbi:MAG: hypothetical protein WCO94_13095, partial [Verrucomicrobiota bacterium]
MKARLYVLVSVVAMAANASLAPAAQTFDQFWADAQVGETAKKSPEALRRLSWWRDGRFGMFIHWN